MRPTKSLNTIEAVPIKRIHKKLHPWKCAMPAESVFLLLESHIY